MSAIDELIQKSAAELQEIYDKRTAGSYTFVGVVAFFALEYKKILEAPAQCSCGVLTYPRRATICVCGNSFDGDNFCIPSACEQEK